MKIRYACPVCEHPAQLPWPGLPSWPCPGCDRVQEVRPDAATDRVDTCVLCGNPELYKKKDFPHWLGLMMLIAASLAFFVAQAFYWQGLAWTILIGSAVFDGALYLTVGDAIVCYRCGAQYRGVPAGPAHHPFELGVAERYRQERLRREQLQGEKK